MTDDPGAPSALGKVLNSALRRLNWRAVIISNTLKRFRIPIITLNLQLYLKALTLSPNHNPQVANDEVYLVVNAGCVEKDLAHINKHLDKFKVGP